MFNKYTAKVGDNVRVTFTDGKAHDMIVWRIDKPGANGTAESSGPQIMAWIRPGGYGTALDAVNVKSVEAIA